MSMIRDEITAILMECTGLSRVAVDGAIDGVPAGRRGVYGTSLPLRMVGATDPVTAARQLADRANGSRYRRLTTAHCVGPFVNFDVTTLDWAALREAGATLATANRARRVAVEIAPPNIGSPFNLVHYRAICLARFLAGIYRALGHSVQTVLFWNDCGTPAARLVDGHRRAGATGPPATGTDIRRLATSIEYGHDADAVAVWHRLRDDAWSRIAAGYREEHFAFDRVVRESDNARLVAGLAGSLVASGAAEVDSDGSVVARLGRDGLPDRILVRGDGGSVYLSRDLAALTQRRREKLYRNVYVVSRNQETHFHQLMRLSEYLDGPLRATEFVHAAFGLVRPRGHPPEAAMAAAVDAARDHLRRHHDLHIAAEVLGAVALRLFILHRGRRRDITVDAGFPDASSIAAAATLIRAATGLAGMHKHEAAVPAGSEAVECDLFVRLDRTPDVLRETADRLEPRLLLDHALRLCAELQAIPAGFRGHGPWAAGAGSIVTLTLDLLGLPGDGGTR